ncbi:peptidoglycan monomer (N-acetylglucosamine-1,6-anhydro-N-acetylmuramic acid-tetrapeptide) uptake protein (major facilitator superfamily protein) [Escherichia coli]|uniref:Peptidoglycan monomer (N-acetylglucosamine-1,6-anhydro-N-acetylmuramic acid-tetrapeptide) uptake protein (Major facilitator superfamily protein) n=1 Tax=Escherichia coli TaxID=562 RepID=A0A376TLS0_ECOLX|nr:peptidoglycan monomer (N-acetylglucosamine-1,6-anhydro-N-acetylmuramic acid-tetrapeptide) uptake protein (major facilitator superfamily protein) [Escherichia coli]
MQRLSLFRALLIFGILQGASNAGYWLLSITDKHLYSMGAAVFFENLCGGMGTSAFVALLMTLCNKSFSATQFALLSALSAVGRVMSAPWRVGLLKHTAGRHSIYSPSPLPYRGLFCCWLPPDA